MDGYCHCDITMTTRFQQLPTFCARGTIHWVRQLTKINLSAILILVNFFIFLNQGGLRFRLRPLVSLA